MSLRSIKPDVLEKKINRRATVAGGVALAAGASLASSALAQDGTPVASPVETEGGGLIQKSSMEGVPDVILRAPEPFKSYEGTPANGGKVHYTVLLWAPPATPHGDNRFWQELESRLNVERFEVTEIPVESYEEKVSALLAGGDLGDLFYVHTGIGPTAALNQAIQQGAFTDLTDELSGENLQKYPNLARFPAEMWEQSKINGRIYGVPQPLPAGAAMTWYRQDWAEKLGKSRPTNAEEMFELFQAFREQDPDGNGSKDTYAQSYYHNAIIEPMFRVPNGWRLNDDGTLTNRIETQEFIDAVLYQKRLWDSGLIHPDAASITTTEMIDMFFGGQTGAMTAGFGTWFGANGRQQVIKQTQPEAILDPIMPIAHDGGEVFVYPDAAYFGFVGIPTSAGQDQERLEELLRICDYFYPPFGSEEYIFQNYGLPDIHHTMDENGDPVLTPQGNADIANLLYGFLVLDLYIYHPGFPEEALQRQRIVEEMMPNFVRNPVVGLYSAAQTEKGPRIDAIVSETLADVILGRKSEDELPRMQEEWRSQGGDEIRREYEELLAQAD